MEHKYCKYCGELIDSSCIICPKCGKQIEELNVINNQSGMMTKKIEYNIVLDIFLLLFLTPIGLIYILMRPKEKLIPIEEYNAMLQAQQESEKIRQAQEELRKSEKLARKERDEHMSNIYEKIAIAIVIGCMLLFIIGMCYATA